MKGKVIFTSMLIVLTLLSIRQVSAAEIEKAVADGARSVAFLIDFTDYEDGSVEAWLKEKGFDFEKDARDRRRIDLDVGKDGLIVEAKRSAFGILPNESVDLQVFKAIRLEWGILAYPDGASWEKNVRSEAIMVIVFFGYEKLSSGHALIPNAPYFIGLFLGKDDAVGKSYVGRFFKKSGRYVCLGNPGIGETVVSEYDLISAFKRKYKKDDVPHISGIAISVDTTSSTGDGRSMAYIKSIEFLE